MLDTSFFKNPRFTAASVGIMLLFFAMFGSIFLQTQYLQFVMGYTALQAGVRLLPMAVTMLIVAPNAPQLVERFGTKLVVGTGLTLRHPGDAADGEPARPTTSPTGATWPGASWSSPSAWASRWARPRSRSWARCPARRPASARR